MLSKRTVTAFALVATAFFVVLAQPAEAHDRLLSTTPINGAVLDTSPSRITLLFDSLVRPGAAISLVAPSGTPVVIGSPRVDASVVEADVPALTELGAYTVQFRIVGLDDHPIAATYSFTLRSVSASNAATPSSSMRGFGVLVAIIAVVLGGLFAILAVQLRRARRSRP